MVEKKRFQILSIGEFRRIAIRNPLIAENNSEVSCKWNELETKAKLLVTICPIEITDGLKSKKVPKDTDAVLTCKVLNNLVPVELKFKWKKDGKPIEIDGSDKYEILVEGDTYQLKVKNFNKKDEGLYEIYLTEPIDYEISSSARLDLERKSGEFLALNVFYLYFFLFNFNFNLKVK